MEEQVTQLKNDKEAMIKKIQEQTVYLNSQKAECKTKFNAEKRKLEEENHRLQADANAT